MGCITCGRGFHDECIEDDCVSCHPDIVSASKSLVTVGGGKGAPVKNPEDVKDRHSTGRKRAAVQYPLFRDKPCEWQGKKNCGGGLEPITGCINGLQQHRHHGPVKDTLMNDPRNIHRICNPCHARWHAKNDPLYAEDIYRNLPHEPQVATELELIANEAEWRLKK